ncbi:MAG: heavy metal translocating P-type ATPase [Thermoanaerobaculia bacterium]|jgi:Cd2+/Zn2+-exporting ATPase|nr:heavy metal translocating P-type ATPase [Thermoanaerobaculia bacterium]
MSSEPVKRPRAFKITGMDCAEEIALLQREVGPVVGGGDLLGFDLLRGRMTVAAEPSAVTDTAILAAVKRAGLGAEPWAESGGGEASERLRRRRFWSTLVSGVGALGGFALHAALAGGLAAAVGTEGLGDAHEIPLAARLVYALGIVAGLFTVAPKAWLAVRRLRPDMNLLMTIAVAGAILIGEWFEAATVSFLFAFSLALESWSIGRARRAIAKLLDLVPPTARLVTEDGEKEVDPALVPVGSRIAVRPGERLPLDGRVVAGRSTANQAPITGESRPIDKAPGDEVYAGSINGSGAIEIETTAAAEATMLAKILRLVEEAQARRSPSERWVDRFAAIYTPVVFGLAIAVGLLPPLVAGGNWSEWGYRALVLLVIGCPCALVVSTPVAIVAGLAAAARHGVLIKGGLFLEAPARIRAFAFDKTGTLTHGRPRVLEVTPLSGHDEREVLERLAALEARSEHPLAIAIREHAAERGIDVPPAEEFRALEGKGAAGLIGGREYWVGSHRYLEERGQETPEVHEKLEAIAASGCSVVVLGNDTHVCGLVAVADGVRAEARQALDDLRRLGIEATVMLSGDNRGTAETIARQVGVTEVRAELLPDEKVGAIAELVDRYGQVAMVGDGINDAPALASASLGIAMGGAGSDATIETADIALLSDDLSRLPWLVRHSRKALAIIRQNIAFSLAVKALFVVLTFAGFASLWAAIAADMGATLIVIANALRLLGSSDKAPVPRE